VACHLDFATKLMKLILGDITKISAGGICFNEIMRKGA
jgi:hypothetical protein